MHVVTRLPRRIHERGRRMYSPRERGLVRNDLGLGEVDGMFNIGKMFTRLFTVTPSSFKLKNIAGAIGSAVSTFGTFGIANVASEIAGPSGLKLTKGTVTGAHSKPMQYVGYGTMAAAAAVGLAYGGYALLGPTTSVAGGTTGAALTTGGIGTASSGSSIIGAATSQVAAGGSGFFGTVGSIFSTVGSGLMSVVKSIASVLPVAAQVLGGGGSGQSQQVQQGGMTQAEYDAQQAQAQAAYNAQVAAQNAMYMPATYQETPSMAYGQPVSMNSSYGDLRSPYTAITEDGQQVQIDPITGQVIQSGLSTPMLIGGGAIILLIGWYAMSDK